MKRCSVSPVMWKHILKQPQTSLYSPDQSKWPDSVNADIKFPFNPPTQLLTPQTSPLTHNSSSHHLSYSSSTMVQKHCPTLFSTAVTNTITQSNWERKGLV